VDVKVLILGSGVIGVTSAYYLARAGHEVVVIDRQAGPALETSYANAGEVSPGYASPWAGPGVPLKAIKWLLMKHGPLVIRPNPDPVMWWWLLKMLRNCTAARYAVNKSRMIPLAEYSRDCLRALRAEIGIRYDERSQGTLQLFRKQQQLDHTGDDIAVLGQLFRSRDYISSETELVIVVTPYLVDPTHHSKLTDPAKGFVAASDMQTTLLGKLVASYGLAGTGVDEKTLQGPMGFILD